MHISRKILTLVPIAALATATSFGLGLRTADVFQTVEFSSADDDERRGDVNADGTVDERDAIVILEIAQGYRTPTAAERNADPNGNGVLTVDDAIRVLRSLSSR